MSQTTDLITFIQMAKQNGKVPVRCKHCNYKWEYTLRDNSNPGDKHNRITCPSCGGKTKYENAKLSVNHD